MNDQFPLLILVGVSVGLSLGATCLHIVALIRTKDWRGQIGYIASKIGWALVMLPVIKALTTRHYAFAPGLTVPFTVGVVAASIGFAFVAVDVNRANRVLAASAAHKIGLDAVEQTIASAEQAGDNGEPPRQ